VCGGLTTFSTLQLELVELLDGGHAALAGGYAAASLAAGFAAMFAGVRLARRGWILRP
jgi:CrcB protein